MKDHESAVDEWKRLYHEWSKAAQLVKTARLEIRQLVFGMAEGGPGPTNAQIWDAEALERHADLLRLEMDGFVLGFMS